MDRVAAIILGGGQGTRLFPLTNSRPKPAINFGGRYRLIDVPISNCIHSFCRKIFVITQFLSSSLHQHVYQTYRFDSFSSGFIELLPAEQKPNNSGWFQGTADAVRKNLNYFIETPVDYFLILSGDQLYNMDFQKMVQFAMESNADLVIGALPVEEQEATRMGILKINQQQEVTLFFEKPQTQEQLLSLKSSSSQLEGRNFSSPSSRSWLGSMGIYLFKREALLKLLQDDSREDFGKHLIPTKVSQGNTYAYLYNGYWEDVGTIASFYHANMALTAPKPAFSCYSEQRPIFATHHYLPDPKFTKTLVTQSIICNGCIIEAKEIINSIIGPRTTIGKGTIICDSYVIGNEFYTPPVPLDSLPPQFSIGSDCFIAKAIIDKHVYIGNDVKLVNKQQLQHYDSPNLYIRDGIIVIPRGATIPNGFSL